LSPYVGQLYCPSNKPSKTFRYLLTDPRILTNSPSGVPTTAPTRAKPERSRHTILGKSPGNLQIHYRGAPGGLHASHLVCCCTRDFEQLQPIQLLVPIHLLIGQAHLQARPPGSFTRGMLWPANQQTRRCHF